MQIRVTKNIHVCQNKIMPATELDEIWFGNRMVKGYLAFDYKDDKHIGYVLDSYDAVVVPDMVEVVGGAFTGRIGRPIAFKYDSAMEFYDKPHNVYLLETDKGNCWVMVMHCRKYKQPITWVDRIKALCRLA